MLYPPDDERKLSHPRHGYADSYVDNMIRDWTPEDIAIAERIKTPVANIGMSSMLDQTIMYSLELDKLNARAYHTAQEMKRQGWKVEEVEGEIEFDDYPWYGLCPCVTEIVEEHICGTCTFQVPGWMVVAYTEDDCYPCDIDGKPVEHSKGYKYPSLASAVIQLCSFGARANAIGRTEMLCEPGFSRRLISEVPWS